MINYTVIIRISYFGRAREINIRAITCKTFKSYDFFLQKVKTSSTSIQLL